jgi:transaldolase/glucose-6-phosphate isomerase
VEFDLGSCEKAVNARLAALEESGFAARLWARDDGLWSEDPAHRAVARNRLGWLESPALMRREAESLRAFAAEVAADGFTHALLLGMGGSSLAPEVLRRTFGVAPGALDLAVLDSTSPAAVRAVAGQIDLPRTFFIVSSKSGGTTEVSAFEKYFFEWARATLGDRAGRSFVAITDPGTPLEALARTRGYRRAFLNPPTIGGRFSALSCFGMVPAALIGADVAALLDAALAEERESGARVPAARNPGVALGAALGEIALAGRDKVTLVLGEELAALGDWIEQLLAESTGKDGVGLVPVADELLGTASLYGSDRVFVAVSQRPFPPATEARLASLRAAGHPILRWSIPTLESLGAEFLRWEIATATAGAVLGVDPFDEPNVSEAKQATQAVLTEVLEAGRSPETYWLAGDGDVSIEAPVSVADAIEARVTDRERPAAWVPALFGLERPGDYVAICAYLHRTPERHERLQRLRLACRAATRLATTLGYGPRFLHSTGQLHKGGPNNGIFLQLTADDGPEVPIPGERYDFGTLIRAQAAGDYEVLERRRRRVMRVHLGRDVDRALDALVEAVEAVKV